MIKDRMTMKEMITLASKSCEENSPSPAASLMKFQNGNLIAYGGTFCIQIPCGIDADCAFRPEALLSFFRKDRSKVIYSISKNSRLVVKEGREKVIIPCLETSVMPIIDIIGDEPVECPKFPVAKALKAFLECIDPGEPRPSLQGVCFRDGKCYATDGKILMGYRSGLPKSFKFIVPVDTVKFMATLKQKVTAVSVGGKLSGYVKFYLDDGTTVCTNTLDPTEFPEVDQLLEIKGQKCKLHEDALTEIKGLKSAAVEVTNNYISYQSEGGSEGIINLDSGSTLFRFKVNRKRFHLLLSLSKDNTVFFHKGMISANSGKNFNIVLMGYGPTAK